MLSIGSPAPAFTLRDQLGAEHSLHDFLGAWVVVYFYPEDDTPGCTVEACGFRDIYSDLQEAGIAVLGVSPDSIESHAAFALKHRLPFILLADPEKTVLTAYGAWGMKTAYGKEYEGVLRSSVLIDPHGNVAKLYPKARPETHAAEILADVRSLRS